MERQELLRFLRGKKTASSASSPALKSLFALWVSRARLVTDGRLLLITGSRHITCLPDQLRCRKGLCIEQWRSLKTLGNGLHIEGDLKVHFCPRLESLSDGGLRVRGDLNVVYNPILPQSRGQVGVVDGNRVTGRSDQEVEDLLKGKKLRPTLQEAWGELPAVALRPGEAISDADQCPISLESVHDMRASGTLMVAVRSGQAKWEVYAYEALREWMGTKVEATSPTTRQPLRSEDVYRFS